MRQWRMEEKRAGLQAAGQGGKRGLSGKYRMQIFTLHLKTLCKLSAPLHKLASGRAGVEKNCPWISRKKKEGREGSWSGVKTKIYILMEKRVCTGPWSRHWFEVQSIVYLWCDAESCLSGREGLTWAVFILLFNEKTAACVWTDTQLPT